MLFQWYSKTLEELRCWLFGNKQPVVVFRVRQIMAKIQCKKRIIDRLTGQWAMKQIRASKINHIYHLFRNKNYPRQLHKCAIKTIPHTHTHKKKFLLLHWWDKAQVNWAKNVMFEAHACMYVLHIESIEEIIFVMNFVRQTHMVIIYAKSFWNHHESLGICAIWMLAFLHMQ